MWIKGEEWERCLRCGARATGKGGGGVEGLQLRKARANQHAMQFNPTSWIGSQFMPDVFEWPNTVLKPREYLWMSIRNLFHLRFCLSCRCVARLWPLSVPPILAFLSFASSVLNRVVCHLYVAESAGQAWGEINTARLSIVTVPQLCSDRGLLNKLL